MSVLNKKRRRDILLSKSQFINIFIMIFLGIFVYAGVHAYMDGMKESGDNFYNNYNSADIWLNGENFSNEDLEEIKKIENVSGVERKLTLTTNLKRQEKTNTSFSSEKKEDSYYKVIGEKSKEYKETTLETNFIETNNINKMYVMKGEEFKDGESGIWVEYFFAKNNEIEIGDKLTFEYENVSITEEVKGLVETPDHVYALKDENTIFPTHTDFGYCYVSINEFPENFIVYPTAMVTINDKSKLDETKAEIENKIKSAKAVTDRNDLVSYAGYQSEIDEGKTYSVAFTALFVFIALLSVVTSTNRFVRNQRGQIGTLKALGFSRKKIICHDISYNLILSIIAGILGVILGAFLIGNFFLNMEMDFFEVPEYSIKVIPKVYLLSICVVLLVIIASYLSCRKILKEPAAEALRVERPKVKNSKNLGFTNKGIFKKLSVASKWNLRDISRNKGRTVMGIVGIVGCSMLIIVGFGMLDTMKHYITWKFENINNFEYLISISDEASDLQIKELENKYGNATSETIGIELKNGDKKEANTITVTDAGEFLRFSDHNENKITLENDGIYITEKLANKLNLKQGDEIQWHEFGKDKWYKSKIVGLNRDPQTQNVTMTRKYLESLGIEYKEDIIYTNENLSGINKIDGAESISSIDSLKKGMESMLERMYALIVLLVIIAVALGVVIIYNLGILSYAEKSYQFATLKVLGFSSKKIRKIFEEQGLWLTIISIILSIPLGYLFTSYIFKSALGENYDMPVHINILTYLIATVGTIIVSYFTYKFLSRKIKKIDMVTSLKANE